MARLIRKRDGRIKQYDYNRINEAVKAAYKDTYGEKYNNKELMFCLSNIYDRVNELEDNPVDVEKIQDIVVEELYKVNKEIGESYESYRTQRTIYRTSKLELIDGISGLLDYTNEEVLTENANKQSQLVSTQRDLMAGEVSKYI